MRFLTLALLAAFVAQLGFYTEAQANTRVVTTDCQTLLTTVVETYRRVLLDAGSEHITPSDIEYMLESGDYFLSENRGENRGASARDHIASALRDMNRMIEGRKLNLRSLMDEIGALLRDELAKRNSEGGAKATERTKRSPLPPVSRRFQTTPLTRKAANKPLYAVLSPDQKTLVEVRREFSPDRYLAHLWDFESGAVVNPAPLDLTRFALSPDRTTLFVSLLGDRTFTIDLDSRRFTSTPFPRAPKEDGKDLISVSPDRKIYVYAKTLSASPVTHSLWISDPRGGALQELKAFKTSLLHLNEQTITFAPDSSFFIVHRAPAQLVIWNTSPLNQRSYLTDRSGNLNNPIFSSRALVSPDGSYIAVAGSIFDPATGKYLRGLDLGRSKNREVLAISPDSRWVATAGPGASEIKLSDARNGALVANIATASAENTKVLFSHDGRFLIYRSEDGFWYVRDIFESIEQEANP